MTEATFYLWTTTVGWDPLLQHTFVTTYDPVTNCTDEYYWYCWGVCHPAGVKNAPVMYGEQSGNVTTACCLTTANDSSDSTGAHGGIPSFYGHFGVCHQVANRTLFATAEGKPPMTVAGVHGSHLSYMLYGAYGTKGTYQGVSMQANWEDQMARCAPSSSPTPDDEAWLSERLSSALGEAFQDDIVGEIGAVFANVRSEKDALAGGVLSGTKSRAEFADDVNALIASALMQVADLIGAENTKLVFGVLPGEPVAVLDRSIAAREDELSGS